ncbi:MAG TPA: lipoprotein signal peptidase [Gammaproteobacteria bacterium]|nr:lipoprotein signal peptidase [Gammaproteobacteria bacterium]
MLKWTILSLVIVILDQLSKALASANLIMFDPVPIMPLFNLTLMHNEGAAFSFLHDAGGWQRWFFTGLASVVSIVIIIWIKKLSAQEKGMAISLSLILGGALGNLIDRMRFGYVVDFIDVYYGTAHWPAFNIADSSIFVGAVIMIIFSFREDKNTSEK